MATIAEEIAGSVERLPEHAAREVLDFAQFLLQREESRRELDLIEAQQRSLGDWENSDDDAWNDAPAV